MLENRILSLGARTLLKPAPLPLHPGQLGEELVLSCSPQAQLCFWFYFVFFFCLGFLFLFDLVWFCFLRHYPFRTNVGACLIGLNFPKVENVQPWSSGGHGPTSSYNHCPQRYCSPEAKFLFMPGYQTMAERLAHHLQNCWTLLRPAIEEGAQTGGEVGVLATPLALF